MILIFDLDHFSCDLAHLWLNIACVLAWDSPHWKNWEKCKRIKMESQAIFQAKIWAKIVSIEWIGPQSIKSIQQVDMAMHFSGSPAVPGACRIQLWFPAVQDEDVQHADRGALPVPRLRRRRRHGRRRRHQRWVRLIARADGKSQVRQCLVFYSADS